MAESCHRCKNPLILDQNWAAYQAKRNVRWCTICTSEYDKLRYQKNRIAHIERTSRANKLRHRKDTSSLLLAWAKNRAKVKGIPFSLCKADIVVPDCCPILGIPLSVADGYPTENSPTLDRIHPLVGYVPENVAVISRRANTIKFNASLFEIEAILRWLEKELSEINTATLKESNL